MILGLIVTATTMLPPEIWNWIRNVLHHPLSCLVLFHLVPRAIKNRTDSSFSILNRVMIQLLAFLINQSSLAIVAMLEMEALV